MEMSARARRMERHNQLRKQPALNLVSLMDIFTILVFFLLVSSSSSEQLPNTKDLKLPNSLSKTAVEENLVIMVTKQQILVQGKAVADLSNLTVKEKVIVTLEDELNFQASKKSVVDGVAQQGFSVTIMGDENMPYELLSSILTTCRKANFTQIAFAANQISNS